MPSLPRIVLILILLPQLLVLGLGRGVVICIAPSGHVQVEIAASACCSVPSSTAAAHDGDLAVPETDPDCGSCSDYWIVFHPSQSRTSTVGSFEAPSDATAAGTNAIPKPKPAVGRGHALDPPRERGHVPQHLIHLRSVLLRC